MASTFSLVTAMDRTALARGLWPFAAFPALFTLAVAAVTSPSSGYAARDLPPNVREEAPATQPESEFPSTAVAATTRAVTVMSRPLGGDVVARLSPGSRVSVGGRVNVPTGLASTTALWIAARTEVGIVEGFATSSGLEVLAGNVEVLEMSGRNAARWKAYIAQQRGLSPRAAAEIRHGSEITESAGTEAASLGATTTSAIDIPWLPDTVARWEELFVRSGSAHGVDPALVAIIALVESGGDPHAVSSAGAIGLMQVMPGTAGDIARQRGINSFTPDQMYDPATNVDFGAWYLARQLASFGTLDDPDWVDSVSQAAAAYNGGPGSVHRLLAGGSLPLETQRYREWVRGLWIERQVEASPTLERWLAAGGSRLIAAARQYRTAY